MVNKLFLIFVSALFTFKLSAAKDSSSYYLVYLKDKAGCGYSLDKPWEFISTESIDRRNKFGIYVSESDLPVTESYVSTLAFGNGLTIKGRSKWLNAVLITANQYNDLEYLKHLPFVKGYEFLGSVVNTEPPRQEPIADSFYRRSEALTRKKSEFDFTSLNKQSYGNSFDNLDQNNIPYLHQRGLNGKGLHIAVFDAGFHLAYQSPGMEDLLDKSTIIRDFVNHDGSVWEDDDHGAKVLGFMKSFAPGYYMGSAPMAKYTLCRTEIGWAELPLEEVNWLIAAEFADSLGVDMIIGSLGYLDFDNPKLNHPYKMFDGRSLIASKAANFAHDKGIAVICSAGNSGEKRWGKIGTPADALGSIAIGATDQLGFRAGFSSYGPSSDGRIKPDFMAPGYKVKVNSPRGIYASNGTSYATPVFAGAFACLMQHVPSFAPDSILIRLRKSSTHCNYSDSLMGYGIPDFGLALLRTGYWNKGDTSDYVWQKNNAVLYQNLNLFFWPYTDQTITITIKVNKGKKMKKYRRFKVKTEAGRWYICDEVMNMIKRNDGKIKQIEITLDSVSKSFNRTFNF